MKLAIGSDESTHLTKTIIDELEKLGHTLTPYGALKESHSKEDKQWPRVGATVAKAVANGDCDQGIVLCWTGTGISIAANKIPGIRAALCADAETARGARLWNDANVLALSLRATSEEIAREILKAWFNTNASTDPEDQSCLSHLSEL